MKINNDNIAIKSVTNKFTVTDEMSQFMDLIENTSDCVFLTGKAGTGKSSLLRYYLSTTKKNVVVAAPTGVAAVNIGGVTLHSLFQLPFGPYIPNIDLLGNVKDALPSYKYSKEKVDIINNMDLLVIDEVSMLRADVLDAINDVLCHVRRNQKPFGGIQVLFIGDLYQLPPVINSSEWNLISTVYETPFFFSAQVLKHVQLHMVSLSHVFRQSDDRFILLLNEIRDGQLSDSSLILLNSLYHQNFNETDGFIMLTSHNAIANRINSSRLEKLKGQQKTFMASISGNFSGSAMPAEPELSLKIGARVMLLVNDNEMHLYHNGSIAVVTELKDKSICVQLEDNGVTIEVSPHKWTSNSYSFDKKTKRMKATEIGSFKQLPVRLAWSVTIHKSQGMTFDRVIVDAEHSFSHGQVYVALSRATDMEHLILSSPIKKDCLSVDTRILNFIKSMEMLQQTNR